MLNSLIERDVKRFVVVNPNSAEGRTEAIWPNLASKMLSTLGSFDVAMTSRVGEATELVREALRGGARIIVSVGGDGTHSEVVNGFMSPDGKMEFDAVMVAISSGTGGDLVRTLGLSGDPMEAIGQLPHCRVRAVDLGRLEHLDNDGQPAKRFFINITSFGMGGLVSQLANTTTKIMGGRISFALAAARAVVRHRNQYVQLNLDGERWEGNIRNVAVANGRFFGGGMEVAPKASMNDGLFDVVTFGDMTLAQLAAVGLYQYSGKHMDLHRVHFRRARHIEATSDEVVLLDVDGETPGRLPATFEILPRALPLASML